MPSHLVVIHYGFFAGPHNRTLQLAEPLARLGWRTTALIPDEDGSAAARLSSGDVPIRVEKFGRLRATWNPIQHLRFTRTFVEDIYKLRRVIREEAPDVVLVSGLANPHGAVAASLEGVPVLWQIIDSRLPFPAREPLMALVRRYASAVMFNGHLLKKLHTQFARIKCPNFVYYPPVNTDRFVPSSVRRTSVRAQLGIPHDAFVVGMVANWNAQKGIEFFVRAASLVYREHKNIWFLTIGGTYADKESYTRFVEREIAASGIPPERFVRLGKTINVEDYYPAMDLKVISSVPNSEGTTTTAIEAQACGVPVIATDVGAVREVVDHGRTGLVVKAGDVSSIAIAASSLIRDESLRVRFGTASRKRVLALFSLQDCAAVHEEALAAARSARWKRAAHC